MKMAVIQLNFAKFSASNGLLRVIILIVSFTALGLTAGNFNAISPEVYLLVVIVLCLVLTILGILLNILDTPCGQGPIFKSIDYMTHLYGAWFLFNSSVAKLICAARLSKSDAEAAIRVLSGVFGIFVAGLCGWLAYLTAADKQGFPCRLSTDVRRVDEGIKIRSRPRGQQALFKASEKMTNLNNWNWERSLTWSSIWERLEWNKVFDAGQKQARFFTLVTGITNMIFIARSYMQLDLNEEYFLAIAAINLSNTILLHLAYISGLSSVVCDDLRIFDKSFHTTGGLFLCIGANLMLASTISKSLLLNIQDRTFSSVIGILNGILYMYIGMKEKIKILEDTESSDDDHDNGINGLSPSFRTGAEHDSVITEKEKMMTKQNMMYPQRIRPALIFDPTKL